MLNNLNQITSLTMKKYLSLLLALALVTACGEDKRCHEPKSKSEQTQGEGKETEKTDDTNVTPPAPAPAPAPVAPRAFTAADFRDDMLSPEGKLSLGEEFNKIDAHALDAFKDRLTALEASAVEEIEAGVLAEATRLQTINLPKLRIVGEKAFELCSQLTEVDLPALEELGNQAFAYCRNLRELKLPVAKKLGDKAFFRLFKLRKLELGATKPELVTGTMQEGTEQVETNAFTYTSIAKALIVPAEAQAEYTELAGQARFISLNGDTNLDNHHTTLPEGLLEIDDNGSALSNSKKKEDAETDEDEEDEESDEEDEEKEALEVKNFVLAPKFKTIKEKAFGEELLGLSHKFSGYFLAAGVEKIENPTFKGQSDLEIVEFPELTNLVGTFDACKKLKLFVAPKLTNVPQFAFQDCSSLECIELEGATNISQQAFLKCNNLKYLILGATPPSVYKLGPKANENDKLQEALGIFGEAQDSSTGVQPGQVTIVVPDAAYDTYMASEVIRSYVGRQVKEIIRLSQFKERY